jgi:hypothetical protein
MRKPERKRRTRQHVLADLSVNHVERHVLRCGWTVERMVHDYGIDLELFTFDKTGAVQEGTVQMQLKATERLRRRPGGATFPFRVQRSDLGFWLAQPMPVLLILYEARKDTAYWLYVQSYFRSQTEFNLFAAAKTITVGVPVANVVTPAAVRRFARFRDRILEQIRKVIHEEDAIHPVR